MAAKRLAIVHDAPRALDLRIAVKAAIDKMDWLTASDEALKTLALRQADEIEGALDRAEEAAAIASSATGKHDVYARLRKLEAMCEATRVVGLIGPQLQGVLRDLGGTPAARAAMRKDKPVGSRLAQLRDAAGKHNAEDLDAAAD